MSRHPSDDRLASWMAGGPDEGIGAHIDSCARCTEVLARLDQPAPAMAEVLARTLMADADLEQRVMTGVTSAMAQRAVAETFLGLLGIGIETAKIVFDQEDRR